ncbi:MAG TPA: hypothetical protein VL651_11140, partial [Bacteroidia bacterium]|nr:hypothetical protein [Bacteroidia bacterium]
MKSLLLLPALLFVNMMNAQHYVRTRHNFGLCAEYTPFDHTVTPWSTKTIKTGNEFKAGITHSFSDIFFPEIFFVQHSGEFPSSIEQGFDPAKYKWSGVGAGLLMKLDLFSMDNHKKNGYCFGRVVNLNLGIDYTEALKLTDNNSAFIKRNQLNAKAGLGIYSVWGGSAKSHEAWTIHWEAFYNYGLSPF